jgi:hypothetical protein
MRSLPNISQTSQPSWTTTVPTTSALASTSPTSNLLPSPPPAQSPRFYLRWYETWKLKNREYKTRGGMWNPDIDAVAFLGGRTGRWCSCTWLSSQSNPSLRPHSIRTISMPAGCFPSIREIRCGPGEYLAHEREKASSTECRLGVGRLEQVVVSQEDGLYALPFCIHFWRVGVLEEPWSARFVCPSSRDVFS